MLTALRKRLAMWIMPAPPPAPKRKPLYISDAVLRQFPKPEEMGEREAARHAAGPTPWDRPRML